MLDDNTEQNLIALTEYITQEQPRFGVMLCGTCGNGKTTLVYAFRRVVNYLNRQNHFSFLQDEYNSFQVGFKIVHATDIIRTYMEDIKAFDSLVKSSMLAIDDLGTEPLEITQYGNVVTPMVRLLEHRYDNQLFTIVTTNLTGAEIRQKYHARIADRFNEIFHVIIFKQITYRKQ